jgi:hypothetical protein
MFNNNNKRKKRNDQVVISTNEEYENRIYICPRCRRYLVKISAEEHYCNNCNIPFWPIRQQMREKHKLTTPEGVNKETFVATIPEDPIHQSTSYGRPPKVRGTLKALQDRGIKIKNYNETDGVGNTITHNRYHSRHYLSDEDEEDG